MSDNRDAIIAAYEEQIATMTRIMEAIPETHMLFGVIRPDGTTEEPKTCADWCHACKLDQLQQDLADWKSREAAARDACVWLAQIHGHYGPGGSILDHIKAGRYDEAVKLIQTREQRRLSRTAPTVVRVVAIEDNHGKLDCCDEETAHVWVRVLTWSGRRAYLTGASPFMEAAGSAVPDLYSLQGERFYADLPVEPPPAQPEPGERLEWPSLKLRPPIDEVKRSLGMI